MSFVLAIGTSACPNLWLGDDTPHLRQGLAHALELSRKTNSSVLQIFRTSLPEASKKMLTQHLREMEQDGLIVRKDFSGKLRHVEYSLSHSRGFAALRLINTLATWSREHRPED